MSLTSTFQVGALCVVVVAAAAGAASAKDARLRALVFPSYSQAPAAVRIEAIVAPEAQNRALEIMVDSGTYYRSSTIELAGEEAPRLHVVQFRSMPAGSYEVRVAVLNDRGHVRAMLYHRVIVIE